MCYTQKMKTRFLLGSTVSLAVLCAGAALAQGQPAPTVQLDTITVEGDGGTTTGPVNGYVATRSATGSKANTSITAIPQAVSVLGRDEIDDRKALKVDEALRYTAGVAAQTFGPDPDTDWIFIRGFQATQTGVFMDGLQLYSYGFGGFQIDPFLLERVEVLKGPASVLYGGSPPGGNVYRLEGVRVEDGRLILPVSDKETWTLEAHGDTLTGNANEVPVTGHRAPELKRPMPAEWTAPEPMFNGTDLTGWEPVGAESHWVVRDGVLINEKQGANLLCKRNHEDFRLHFEVNLPQGANSGFYLRGRYEIQLEYEPLEYNPPERRIGSVYGRHAPAGDVPRTPGTWETFDVTLVGRYLTVVRNGVTIFDNQETEGITGGAVDASEAEPGPFYIQGDHAGGLQFRNVTISVPKY